MTVRKVTYKPLLFTTTLRNPSRLKGLLNILSKFNEQVLTNKLAVKILGEIIRHGLYRPTRGVSETVAQKWGARRISENSIIGNELLTDSEVDCLLRDNPQKHQEAGFDHGWPSRFATIFDIGKELGFVYYSVGEKIQFSEIGLSLACSIQIELQDGLILLTDAHPEIEQEAFLNALVKSQRNNPFVKVLNENIPLLLLLEVIKKINTNPDFHSTGISKLELPLLIYWKDSDSEKLYKRIVKLRKDYGYTPSGEVVADICRTEIMEGQDIRRKDSSIVSEYPDEFIRKMRLTGLISLRGNGRFLDINKKKEGIASYVLETYSKYKKYSTEVAYFSHMSSVDSRLVTGVSSMPTTIEQNTYLENWLRVYNWDLIKNELTNLSERHFTKDAVLKYLANPVRLEFLTSLAIKSKFPEIDVFPNYPVDDEGLPTSTAGGLGDIGDIECKEGLNGVLVEVTMAEGRKQTMMEVWPIDRHLVKFSTRFTKAICFFVAPSIYADTLKQIGYVKYKNDRDIYPATISEFVNYLEVSGKLFK